MMYDRCDCLSVHSTKVGNAQVLARYLQRRNFGNIKYVSYERLGAPQPPIYVRGDRAMSEVGHLRNKIAKLEVQFFW
jgi:hypothetical protein